MNIFPAWLVRAVGYCLAFLVAAATVWVGSRILLAAPVVFYSVFAALLLTAVLLPLVDRLEAVGAPRWMAALAGLLLMLVAVFGTLGLVMSRAAAQAGDLRAAVDDALGSLQNALTAPPFSLPEKRVGDLRQRVIDVVGDLLPSPGAGAAMAVAVLSGIAIAVFLVFFLLKDGPAMVAWGRTWTSTHARPLAEDLGARAWDALSGYAVGMIVVATVDAVLIGIGLFVMGVPLAMSLMLLVFLGAFIPVVGATISGVLAVAVTATTVGLWQAAVVLAVVLIAQQLEGNVVQPLVMGRAVRLHPTVIVLAVAVGAVVGGIGGAVVAVPVVAVSYRILDRLVGPASRTNDPVHEESHPVLGGERS